MDEIASADTAARALVERARARPWGLAVAALQGDEVSYRTDDGDDPITATSTFQWGSITKTITGVLVGYSIEVGELVPEATLGDVLGVSGDAAAITVQELATQRSGLPRLPPNLDLTTVDQQDPYAAYTATDLRDALCATNVGPKDYLYSNFGFMTLGRVLSEASGTPYAALVRERILDPLAMHGTGCPPPTEGRLPGYSGATATPWWSTQLPGAGGIGGPISDLAAYLAAHLSPPPGVLGAAIARAMTLHAPAPSPMGYGWGHQGGGWWHNGGTGGFRAFAGFHGPTGTAVALLANSADAEMIDGIGLRTLTEMARSSA